LRMLDRGKSFDRLDVPSPDLDALPERGMGLFIIENFVDEVHYTPGDPNELVMVKVRGAAKLARDRQSADDASADPKPRSSSGVRATERPRASPSPGAPHAPLKYGTGRK